MRHIAVPVASGTPGLWSSYCPPCGYRGPVRPGRDLAFNDSEYHNKGEANAGPD